VACALLSRQGPVQGLGYMDEAFDESHGAAVRAGGRFVVKIHPPQPVMLQLAAEGHARVIYTYRDIRDVIYSFAHKLLTEPSEILEHWSGPIMEGFRQWTAAPRCLVIRYEDFCDDSPTDIRRLARFLDIPIHDAWLRLLDNEFDLEANRSRAQNKCQELLQQQLDLSDPQHACRHAHGELVHWNHIRSGAIGGWQYVATVEELEQLRDRFGPWLIEHAYEPDDQWVERLLAARQASSTANRRWWRAA